MDIIILRDQESARKFLLQGLWFQRAVHPSALTAANALRWALVIADAGHPLPPIGFVADIGHAALGLDRDAKARKEDVAIPGLDPRLARVYEDHVLGKIYADHFFERASDALKRIEPEKRGIGLAYIIKQIRERGGIRGVEFSPGIIRGLLETKADELLGRGFDMLNRDGPMPLIIELYKEIIAAAQRMADVLAEEDVKALEQKTALQSMGEYVAHRQVLQMAARLEEGLPKHKVKPLFGRREVPTRILDEDSYPVGGFSSISTRGGIESLLQSQLAYMEKEKERRPDLFDVKFLRDELYYYSRDENQFLRQRRSFLFVLAPDLVQARFKDAELPCQRIVLALALLLATVRKLSEWLSSDALRFEFLFVSDGEKRTLEEESKLLTLLFREEIENKTVAVEPLPLPELQARIQQHAVRSMCQCLVLSVHGLEVHSDEAVVSEFSIDGPVPKLHIGHDSSVNLEGEELIEIWTQTLIRLLQAWI